MLDKTTEEQIAQIKKEIPDFLDGCRALGIQFCCAFLSDDGGPHDISTFVNAHDDHHLLDMMTSQLEVWRDCNHPKEP